MCVTSFNNVGGLALSLGSGFSIVCNRGRRNGAAIVDFVGVVFCNSSETGNSLSGGPHGGCAP